MEEVSLPCASGVQLTVSAPPSKSYTHRALIAAALSEGRSLIRRPLSAADTEATREALCALGVTFRQEKEDLSVEGCGGAFPEEGLVRIDCGDSGTTLRLMTAVSLLASGPVTLTGSARMQERPIGSLAEALNRSGARISYEGVKGFPPVMVEGSLSGGRITLDPGVSSQFVSSVLMAAPYAKRPVELSLSGTPVSAPYIGVTTDCMEAFGVQVVHPSPFLYRVPQQSYRSCEYTVEGDWSSASYFFAIAAACGGSAAVRHLSPSSCQGDRAILPLLESMGCAVNLDPDGIRVQREGGLWGITADMSGCPDLVPTIAALASCAETPTYLSGVAHLRFKESDRIDTVCRVCRIAGASAELKDDTLVIRPHMEKGGGVLDPAGDHRIAMAGAIVGLCRGDVAIRSPGVVEKSFPGFWAVLKEAKLCSV